MKKEFNPKDQKTLIALDELGEWIGKHNLTIHELMGIFSSFFAFTAVKSGDPFEFMAEFTRLFLLNVSQQEKK